MAEPEFDVAKNLNEVKLKILEASKERQLKGTSFKHPRLVAVSKTKPVKLIIDCYDAGQRHFGENYVQELSDKANNEEIQQSCPEICWHLIGPLQSNKAKLIVKCPNIHMVETVNSIKLANLLNKSIFQEQKPPLKVMVQVNTSGEAQKSGEDEQGAEKLCSHIVTSCPHLKLSGLMTIGAFDHDLSTGPNPDFQRLLSLRSQVAETLSWSPDDLELSMGMSNDFEHAVTVGSTNVRVGSLIFGARSKKSDL